MPMVEQELECLQQRNRDFSVYYEDFQHITTEPSWNTEVKQHALARGLSNKLKVNLVYMDVPEEFDQYVALLQLVDN